MGHRLVRAAGQPRAAQRALRIWLLTTRYCNMDMSYLKAVEVVGVLLAGGLFVWWQLRDVKREQAKSKAKKESQRDKAA
jgi:hypothetical protein